MFISFRYLLQRISLLLFCFTFALSAGADVLKPALIEINVNQLGQVDIEARVSIEALLTGINSQYKNTQDAPNAAEYDVLRKMQSDELKQAFSSFQQQFLDRVRLNSHLNEKSKGQKLSLEITDVAIPELGYTKVPRISVIKLKSTIELDKGYLTWYYPMKFGDNAVRLRQVDKIADKYHWSEWQWLRKDQASEPFSLLEVVAKRSLYKIIIEYVVIGFEHILPKGLDHILFILGLFFFSTAFKPLFWQITMFTVAHTITLGLAMNGMISLPANIVEPLIALSIAYIGVENVFSKHLKNYRLLLVFLFGLLHGLGFASVLAEFGLPENDFVIALISFNVGVELGQLGIILMVFILIGYWFKNKPWYRASISTPASLIIASIGIYWFIQRLDLNF